MNFKKFFSRTVMTAFIVVIEVAMIALIVNFFSEGFIWLRIIGLVSAALTAMFIINKPQIAEIKLPWIIGLAIVPILATITYIFLGNAHFNRKQQRSIAKIYLATQKYTEPTEEEKRLAEAALGEYAGLAKCLSLKTISSATLNNRTEFLPSGERFLDSLLSDLEKAEKFVFMEYFIIEEGEMWGKVLDVLKRKAADGVEIRVIYDDIGCAGKLKHSYYKKLRAAGINCKKFNVITLRPSGVFNNRDHRKITVIDGKIGYMGGINLADEYINVKQPFGHWKDTGVRVEGAAVKTLISLFLATFDYKNKNNACEYEQYFKTDIPVFDESGCVIPFGCGPLAPYDDQVGRNVFLNLISRAQKSLYITTPYLIVDQAITNAIMAASRRGVDVRIITPGIPDKKIVYAMTRSSYMPLLNAGVRIFEYTPGFMHAKQILTDDKIAFVGTMNLDYRSLAHHFECGAVICGSPCINDIKTDFEEILNVSKEKTVETSKQNPVIRIILSILAVFRPLF